MKRMIYFLLIINCILLTSITMPTAIQEESKIKIVNKSDLNIDHIYFSAPDKNTWDEDDILGDDEVLEPNESIVVMMECGNWDVKLVLEDGGTCLGYDEHICGAEVWEITNADCDGDGKEDEGK
jgi:hypothetical protein